MPSADLTTLPGWSSLSSGSHSITIVAKAENYRDSEPSAAVTVEKAAEVTLISFTIGGTSYQAEEGMTWEEWVNSSYNTDGYYVSGELVNNSDGGLHVYDLRPASYVKPTDTIVSLRDYRLASGGN